MNGLRRDLSILEASYCTIFEKRGTYATFTATIRQQGGFTHRYIRHLLDIAFGKAIRSAREVPTDQRDQEKKSVGDIVLGI